MALQARLTILIFTTLIYFSDGAQIKGKAKGNIKAGTSDGVSGGGGTLASCPADQAQFCVTMPGCYCLQMIQGTGGVNASIAAKAETSGKVDPKAAAGGKSSGKLNPKTTPGAKAKGEMSPKAADGEIDPKAHTGGKATGKVSPKAAASGKVDLKTAAGGKATGKLSPKTAAGAKAKGKISPEAAAPTTKPAAKKASDGSGRGVLKYGDNCYLDFKPVECEPPYRRIPNEDVDPNRTRTNNDVINTGGLYCYDKLNLDFQVNCNPPYQLIKVLEPFP